MFQLSKSPIFNTASFSFEHPKGYRLAVLPSKGAVIMDLTIQGTPILEVYQSKQEIDNTFFYKNEVLAPFPNRIKNGRYQWQNKTYQFPINNPEFQSALHGFVSNKPFKIVETICKEQFCSIILLYQYQGIEEAFPFSFDLELTYTLDIEQGFQLDYTIKNTGTTSMPAGFGWHPYFTFGNKIDTVTLKMPSVQRIEVDEYMIPTGKQSDFTEFDQAQKIGDYQFDTCFKILDHPTTSNKVQVSLEQDNNYIFFWQAKGQQQFNFIQLFIPPSRSCIAIEPMTCNVDAFNNQEGLVILKPNEEMGSSCGVNYYENLF